MIITRSDIRDAQAWVAEATAFLSLVGSQGRARARLKTLEERLVRAHSEFALLEGERKRIAVTLNRAKAEQQRRLREQIRELKRQRREQKSLIQSLIREQLSAEEEKGYSDASSLSVRLNSIAPRVFAERPHLIMPLGFEEYRVLQATPDQFMLRQLAETYGLATPRVVHRYEAVFRDPAGGWYIFDGLAPSGDPDKDADVWSMRFAGPRTSADRFETLESWLDRLRLVHASPDPTPHSLWLPSVWTPRIQEARRIALGEVIQPLLRSLSEGRLRLSE